MTGWRALSRLVVLFLVDSALVFVALVAFTAPMAAQPRTRLQLERFTEDQVRNALGPPSLPGSGVWYYDTPCGTLKIYFAGGIVSGWTPEDFAIEQLKGDCRTPSPHGAEPGGAPRTLPVPHSTREETDSGGWSGPCEQWWESSDYSFDAMRVCRVTTYLIHGMGRNPDWNTARTVANELFRICWGAFPRSGAPSCNVPNAWATPRGWILPNTASPPVVITLQASEMLQSDDEVAFALSHEMGHAVDPQQTINPSRENEERADVAGIGFVIRAGFDARSAGRGLQMIGRERGQGIVGNVLQILLNHAAGASDVHPLTQARIALMKQVYAKGCVALENKPIGCKEGWK